MSVANKIWDAVSTEGLRCPDTYASQWIKHVPDTQARHLVLSLSDGYPALALLFAELAAHDRIWESRLHAVLAAGAARLRSAPITGLFAGPMSLGFALHMARIATGGYESAIANLDAAISKHVMSQLAGGAIRQRLAVRNLTMADYDLISGLSGTLRYFLLDSAKNTETSTAILKELIHLVRAGNPDRPGWAVAHPPVTGTDPAKFPLGHVNVGVAHGAAGILAALSLALQKDLVVPGQNQAVMALSEWLLANRLEDEHGINWPAFIPLHRKAATATTHPNGWCYGIPGITRALQLADTVVGGTSLGAAADAAIRSMVARTVSLAASVEFGLCHGWAGTLHALWRCMTSSAVRLPEDWGKILSQEIIARYDSDSRLGYRTRVSVEPDPIVWADDVGFIRGATGISLSLHRFARNAPPATPWDSALLLG